MSPGIPFTITTKTITQITEEDTAQPVVVSKQTVTIPGESQTTKDTSVSATVTTTTKNTNLAPNFVQPGGPFPPFVSTVATAPSVGLAPSTTAPGSTASAGASPIPAAPTSPASVVNPGSSPVLTFVPNNPAQEIDVTTPSITSTKETDVTRALMPTTTNETDTTSPTQTKKVTTTVTTVTASPAPTNQFEHAFWSVDAGKDARVIAFQLYAAMSIFVPIYRITNDDDSVDVDVMTDQQDGVHAPASFSLKRGTSIDLSWENISIRNSSMQSAHGSYQYLNSALASQQVQQAAKAAPATAAAAASASASGGGGGDPGDPQPGDPFDPLTFPDATAGNPAGGGGGSGGGGAGGGSGQGGGAGDAPGAAADDA